MILYRFVFDGASITYASRPQHALYHAAQFARYSRRELLAIEELRPLQPQLALV